MEKISFLFYVMLFHKYCNVDRRNILTNAYGKWQFHIHYLWIETFYVYLINFKYGISLAPAFAFRDSK